MNQKTTLTTLLFFKRAYLLVFLFSCSLSIAQSSKADMAKMERHFDGPYLGLTMGTQNIFGGAFIDDLDVLGQKSGFVVEFSSGYRKQFLKDRIIFGAAIQFGITDGDLTQIDNRNQLKIDYKNNSQFGYGIQLGLALGQKKTIHVYTYGNVTKRNFDISVTGTNELRFTQKDGQVFVRYGLGIEIPILRKLNIHANAGRINVDFRDLRTNMDVDDKTDFNLGLIYQF